MRKRSQLTRFVLRAPGSQRRPLPGKAANENAREVRLRLAQRQIAASSCTLRGGSGVCPVRLGQGSSCSLDLRALIRIETRSARRRSGRAAEAVAAHFGRRTALRSSPSPAAALVVIAAYLPLAATLVAIAALTAARGLILRAGDSSSCGSGVGATGAPGRPAEAQGC